MGTIQPFVPLTGLKLDAIEQDKDSVLIGQDARFMEYFCSLRCQMNASSCF